MTGRPKREWEKNIRMDFKEIRVRTKNWIDSAQNKNYWRAFVNTDLNFRV